MNRQAQGMTSGQRLMRELESELAIDKNDLDTAWMRLPQLFYTVSSECVTANTERDRAKATVDEVYARLDKKLRQEAEEEVEAQRAADPKSKAKVTEGRISQMIADSAEMQEVKAEYLSLKELADRWAALKESYQQKSYALRGLDELYAANYFTRDGGGAARSDVLNDRADRIRQEAGERRYPSIRPERTPPGNGNRRA
jgi:hypothetical protein